MPNSVPEVIGMYQPNPSHNQYSKMIFKIVKY